MLPIVSAMAPILGGAPALFLDRRTDVAVAYSMRRLRKAYSGPLVRIRRSSDNAALDFGDGQLAVNASAVATWAAGTAFVARWYDQSGLARDLIQGTMANQPAFGALSNGLPGLTCDGVNDSLRSAAFALAQPASFNLIYRNLLSDGLGHYVFDGLTTAEMILRRDGGIPYDNGMYAGAGAPNSDNGVSMPVLTRGAVGGAFNNASSRLEVNAATVASFTGTSGAQGLTGLTIGAIGSQAAFSNLEYQEFILFNTAHNQALLKSDNAAMRAAWRF